MLFLGINLDSTTLKISISNKKLLKELWSLLHIFIYRKKVSKHGMKIKRGCAMRVGTFSYAAPNTSLQHPPKAMAQNSSHECHETKC